jgi:hypothetical protein
VNAHAAPIPADPRLLARGLAAFRIFFGLILFTNGLAKLFEFRNIDVGPYSSFLINKAEAQLGFRVKVAATVDAADAGEEAGLHALLDRDGIPATDRLVRRVARMGFADHGLALDTVWPEPALTADGAWWHPVGITDPAMQVASSPLPLVTVLAVIRATLDDPGGDRADALQAFRCT